MLKPVPAPVVAERTVGTIENRVDRNKNYEWLKAVYYVDNSGLTLSVSAMLRPTTTAILLFFAIVGLLTGCVTPGYPPITGYQHTASPGADQCLDQWGNFQARVNSAEVYDAQHWPLPDYPFLRLNRAASFVSQQDLTSEQQSLWLAQAYERGKQARQIENQKLADPIDLSGLESCLSNLLAGLSEAPAFWSSLRTKIYPDSYLTSRQIIGLYYLFRPLVAWQVEALNEKVTGIFQQYESNNQWQYLPVSGP